ATSVPVDGFSPGSGATLGVVRGAASRLVLSATGGGGAGATVLFGDLAFGAGAGLASAGRSTASGALRASSVGSGAATRCTRYVGGTGLRATAAPATRNSPASACPATVPTSPTLGRLRLGTGQADVHAPLHDRRGDHEDDEQHERHIHERRDVDVGVQGQLAVPAQPPSGTAQQPGH